jgi:hypothetical protein
MHSLVLARGDIGLRAHVAFLNIGAAGAALREAP